MAEYAIKGMNSVLIAFWNGVSRGTNDMIQWTESYGMEVYIIHYEENIAQAIKYARNVFDTLTYLPEEKITVGMKLLS